MRTRPPRTRARRSALAAVAASAAVAVLALPQPAGAAESSPVGFGGGTTGGGSTPAVTVSTLDAFKSAVAGDTAKVVRVSGRIPLSGQVDVGSNTTTRSASSTARAS